MADFKRGVVYMGHISSKLVVSDASQIGAMPVNQAGQVFGARRPATLEFSIRLHSIIHAKTLINDGAY